MLDFRYTIIEILVIISIFGCNKNQITSERIPSVTTAKVTNIGVTEVICGGIISDDGGSPIITAGVCWSDSPIPSVLNKVSSGVISCDGTFLSKITDLEGGRTYFIRAYSENSYGIGYGTTVVFKTLNGIDEVLTEPVTNLTDTSATLNGKIVIANMPSTDIIFEFGQTYNYESKKMLSQKPITQTTNENVSVTINGLIPGTTYHYRIKAISNSDTIYGTDMTFNTLIKDADGNVYHTIQIGNQTWMQENLRTTKYSNGDLIGTTSTPSLDISGINYPQYQWPCSMAAAGRYYTYYTIIDSRNICPPGWHVPSDDEWTSLTDYLSDNNYGFEGNRLKISKSLAAQSGWEEDSAPGNVGNDQASNNKSRFTGLASGGRYSNGVVEFVNHHGIWWSSSESSDDFAFFRCIGYIPGVVFRGHFNKAYGLPIRCVKNN